MCVAEIVRRSHWLAGVRLHQLLVPRRKLSEVEEGNRRREKGQKGWGVGWDRGDSGAVTMNGSFVRSDDASSAPKRARNDDVGVKSPESGSGSGGGSAAAASSFGGTERPQVRQRGPSDRVDVEAEAAVRGENRDEVDEDDSLPRVGEVRQMAKMFKNERIIKVKELISQIEDLEFQLSVARDKLQEAEALCQQVEAAGADNQPISMATMQLLRKQLESRLDGGGNKEPRRESVKERDKGGGERDDAHTDERVRQVGGGANDRPREDKFGSGKAASIPMATTGRAAQAEAMPGPSRNSTVMRERREDSTLPSRPSTAGSGGRGSDGMARSSPATGGGGAAAGPKSIPQSSQPSSAAARASSAAVQQSAAIAKGSPHSSQPSPPPAKRPRLDPPPTDGLYTFLSPSEVSLVPQVNLCKERQPLKGLRGPKLFPCGHKRKMRTLVFNPADPEQMLTSALDGNINFWQVAKQGKEITGKGYLPAMSEKQHWPEDIAWHPTGRRIVAVYSADQNDTQVAIVKNSSDKKPKISFLSQKPHDRGIINSVVFLAWDDYSHFITGGSDHGVVMWSASDDGKELKVKMLHRDIHSSAVSGVDGLRHRAIILSGGMDKRLCGYDPRRRSAVFLKLLDNKIVSVMLNPKDDNLFLVQCGTKERQLMLFDIRTDKRELHSFGWQQTSDTLSALIRPAWSPDGLYIATGSTDPKLHIFDIRYTGRSPAQTISAHTKRVLRVEWHPTWPLLTSISSDLCIGMHAFQP